MQKDHQVVAPAPEAPVPQSVAHPEPRTVFEAPGGRLRLVVHDWTDAPTHHKTFQVLALHQRHWEPATGEEKDRLFFAFAAHYDQQSERHEG